MNRKKFREGLRDGLPIALGYLAVSFGIGISCHTAGISAFQGFLMSLLNNASAGEYGGITVITENSGVFMMVLMTLIINARYLLMSCALSQRLHPDTPLVHRLLIGFDVTDELFGIAIALWLAFGAWRSATAAIDQLMDKEWPEEKRQRVVATQAQLGVVGTQVRGHGAGVGGFVVLLFIKTNGEGAHRLLAAGLHQRGDQRGIDAA